MRSFIRRNAVPLAIGAASRAFSITLLAIFGSQSTGAWPQLTDAGSPFAAWDGQWFLSIAAHGYHAQPLVPIGGGGYHDFAFFPVWPLLIRISSLGILPLEPVAVVLANLLFVAAMVPTYQLFRRLTGEDGAAGRGLALLAFGPAAYVWSMTYSESLFALIVASALLGVSGGRWRPVMVAVAQLTRLTGSALSLAAFVGGIRRRRWDRALVATVIAGPLAFVGWVAFVGILAGRPDGYVLGSPSWYRLSDTSAGPSSILDGLLSPSPYFVVSIITAAAVSTAAVACLRFDREAGTYAVATVAATVLLAHWVNMPRHALVALPAYAILGRWMPSGAGGRVITVLAAASQVVLVAGAIRWASFPP